MECKERREWQKLWLCEVKWREKLILGVEYSCVELTCLKDSITVTRSTRYIYIDRHQIMYAVVACAFSE